MEVTKRSLVLTFGTPVKTVESITIANPANLLEPSEVKLAMERALASGAIGEVVQASSIDGAKYVIQQVDEINLEV